MDRAAGLVTHGRRSSGLAEGCAATGAAIGNPLESISVARRLATRSRTSWRGSRLAAETADADGLQLAEPRVPSVLCCHAYPFC